jgi:D-alanine-D-alanine ligase-like ATP-grasp enzyme
MSGISQIANTMATGQRRNVEKNSTAARKDHPIYVMPSRVGTKWLRSPKNSVGLAEIWSRCSEREAFLLGVAQA